MTDPSQENLADEIDEHVTDKDGLRIAGQYFLREVVRYSGQAAIAFAVIGVIGYAGYWSLKEMQSLPQFLQAVARPFLPPPPVKIKVDPSEAAKNSVASRRSVEDTTPVKIAARKRFRRSARKQLAARTPYHTNSWTTSSDEPTGGRIEYSDGVITQYSWNK
ncbi:MAG: hypothetical protein JSS86_15570 [Cyanobacteria bacterium SZAS LIN-2]|nr:hypothetical protein [Cyanobacteria bacterium SZAS LIN-2]